MSICQLQNDLQRECINPNVLVTKDLLALFDSHSPKMNSSNIKFCTTNCSVQQYIDYVSRRAICKSFCGQVRWISGYGLQQRNNVFASAH